MTATEIIPRGTFVVIEPEREAKISDLIVLPDSSQAKPKAIGVVRAVGPKVTDVEVGDTVHFEVFDWSTAPDECIIIEEGEILAKEER